ncbi:hypothetical protein SCAR479_13352 [Seiridium cardinale]|uniref:Uncharacterized protein n=1 Tax=Seiridium cardinale TaxID=138064 RepID=A0ABR2X879_9PEZI
MKSVLFLLALGVLSAALPLKDSIRDVDDEISEAGFIPAITNALWSNATPDDVAAAAAGEGA